MTRRIGPRFELWRCARVVGGWSDWLLTDTFEVHAMAIDAMEREVAARQAGRFGYPMKFEIRQVSTTIVDAGSYTPEERK